MVILRKLTEDMFAFSYNVYNAHQKADLVHRFSGDHIEDVFTYHTRILPNEEFHSLYIVIALYNFVSMQLSGNIY